MTTDTVKTNNVTAETIIEAKSLGCLAGHQYLLQNIDWTVRKGEQWVVFGMNGCGKTTLLSTIAGYRPFTHGKLKVFGETYTQDNVLALRRRIGWVSSSFFDRYYHKEPSLNIVLSGKFGTLGLRDGITDADIIRAKKLLRAFRLGDKINQPFHLMSKGERQNVLIARALLGQPDLLILDEPCSGLDILARDHLLDTVTYLADNTDVTIIYVTHYTEEITPVFDKTMLLSHGRVYAQGVTKDLFTGDVMERFLGYPVEIMPREHGRFQVHAQMAESVDRQLGGVLR